MRKFRGLMLLALVVVAPVSAATEGEIESPVTVLDTVVVSGKLPGPGLWKVSKGEHVLWILGTLAPLPKRMTWESGEVEATIARSQEVLMPPSVTMNTDMGMFRSLLLLPSLLKARNNPDKDQLADVVPADLYARWLVLKQRYLGRDRGVEKRRPILAAQKLQQEALDDVDLSMRNVVDKVVSRAAKKYDVVMTHPSVAITIADPKALIREFSESPLDDIECFRKTIERLESEIEIMKLRANAWALGEIGILRKLPHTDNTRACTDALLETRIAQRHGFNELETQVKAAWLSAAETALEKNASSFALLRLGLLLREGGYLDALKARGYEVEAPDAVGADEEKEANEATVWLSMLRSDSGA